MKVMFLGLLVICCVAASAPITANSSVDDVLDALDARGKDLKTLTADVKTSNSNNDLGDTADADIRTGHIFLEILPDGDTRWHAIFDQKITGRKMVPFKHEISYANGALIDRTYPSKTQKTRQILKTGEKMQVFNLDGPFPLPLGQDKADVHKHFDVQKIPLTKDDPAGTIHLQLTPIAKTDLARKFKTVDLWVDPKTNMPTRITTLETDGTSRQNDLSNVKVNQEIKDTDLEMEKIDFNKDTGWNVSDEGPSSRGEVLKIENDA